MESRGTTAKTVEERLAILETKMNIIGYIAGATFVGIIALFVLIAGRVPL